MQQINRSGISAVLVIALLLATGAQLRSRGWIINIDQSGAGRPTSTR